jgi:PD-(D/E)XK nuclease superfamily
MVYSFTQLSQYLSCPRRYRYRYLDGWQEKETRAGLLFGRAFEAGLAAYFRREDAVATFFEQWAVYQHSDLDFSRGDTWKSMFEQGIKLLELFAQHDRVQVRYPRRNLQVRVSKPISPYSEFTGYIDAYGDVDGRRCLLDWKTTGARYPNEPAGLLALDPQLACYSWLTGEPEVSFVVFVRKKMPEIQYMRCTITQQQRDDFGALVRDTVAQIEAGLFLPHSGIRFPQNPCTSCSFVGLCLNDESMVNRMLVRNGGGELGWLDEVEF